MLARDGNPLVGPNRLGEALRDRTVQLEAAKAARDRFARATEEMDQLIERLG